MITPAAENTKLYQCLKSFHLQYSQKHRELIDLYKAHPYDRVLTSQLKKSQLYVSATLNLLNLFRGKTPRHYSSDPFKHLAIGCKMQELMEVLYEERDLRDLQNILPETLESELMVAI